MQTIEMSPQAPTEVPQTTLVERIQSGIMERLHAYTHAVSDEAQSQLDIVMDEVSGSPLASSLESLRPLVTEHLGWADREAVVTNLIVTALKTGYGAASLLVARDILRQEGKLSAKIIPATLQGLLGVGAIAWGVMGMRNVGGAEKEALKRYGVGIKRYYRTQAGSRAAFGQGIGDKESLTSQVDRIIRRMTFGKAWRSISA